MIKTKILQFFICYKISVPKVPRYLITSFCKVLYQLFIKLNFFLNIFITQLLYSFHKIIVSVPNYHSGPLICFFITRFRSSAKERMAFHSSLLKFEYVCCFLQISKKFFSTLLKNISSAGWPLGGLHEDLVKILNLNWLIKKTTMLEEIIRCFINWCF